MKTRQFTEDQIIKLLQEGLTTRFAQNCRYCFSPGPSSLAGKPHHNLSKNGWAGQNDVTLNQALCQPIKKFNGAFIRHQEMRVQETH